MYDSLYTTCVVIAIAARKCSCVHVQRPHGSITYVQLQNVVHHTNGPKRRLHCLCTFKARMRCVMLQLQDVAHNCQGQYNLLPMAQCADTASTPLAYTVCNGSCSAGTGNHVVYGPWGRCSATCDGGTQTRTGDLFVLLYQCAAFAVRIAS